MDVSAYINVPIFAIVYVVMEAVKKLFLKTDEQRSIIPVIAPIIGAIVSCAIYNIFPDWIICANGLEAFTTGVFSGAATTGTHQIFKQFSKFKTNDSYETEDSYEAEG